MRHVRRSLVIGSLALATLAVAVVMGGSTDTHAQAQPPAARPANRPNIVFIMMDDFGYGDAEFLNPESKIKTPHLDVLAARGMVFTDAHTAAGVCTPARYAALTGRFSFRSRLQARILGGYDPRLIEPGRPTIASMLKEQGYATAVIGKWHLGMTFPRVPGAPVPAEFAGPAPDDVDYSQPITQGPREHGFDYFFGIPSSIDIAPYVYMENDRFLAPATVAITGPRGLGSFTPGKAAADFKHVDVMPATVAKAREYIAARAKEPNQPFFLFFASTGVHNPIVPAPAYVGQSAAGPYGDFVQQMDHSVGQIVEALRAGGLERDTMIIFTSDNGPAQLTDAVKKEFGHDSAGGLRGLKASLYEGGHRMPFVVTWPAQVKAGLKSAEYIGHTDLIATIAELTGYRLPANTAEDSVSFAPLLQGKATTSPFRSPLLIQADAATDLALRRGSMKLVTGRGGPQLYDLAADPKEANDLSQTQPEVVTEMTAMIEKLRRDGRAFVGDRGQTQN